MHRYRDAIVYEKGAAGYERTMFGAYVLFPYSNREEYRDHPFFKSIEKVNIGGLPFLPSETSMVESFIDELISESSQSAFERASLPVGIEEKLAHVDWSKRDVLIGTFRSKNQFRICKEKNMYYIPQKLISNDKLPVHYVAMFQTNRIFPNESGIYYYGEVLRTARVARKSITEVPMKEGQNPNEAYYKFYVREWLPVTNPILHREEGFISGFTNLFLLEHSQFIRELLLGSEEEYRLYTELKRRTNQELQGEDTSENGFTIGDMKVLIEDDSIIVNRSGHSMAYCDIGEFRTRPSREFRKLLSKLH
jgi:hypothetical protein